MVLLRGGRGHVACPQRNELERKKMSEAKHPNDNKRSWDVRGHPGRSTGKERPGGPEGVVEGGTGGRGFAGVLGLLEPRTRAGSHAGESPRRSQNLGKWSLGPSRGYPGASLSST